MARIRTIKPEFFTHDALSALPEVTHYGMAAGLLTYADDEGYFNANPALIKAALFPIREPSVSIHDMLTQLAEAGFIEVLPGKDGRTYGRIVNFLEHQRVNRPTPSKIKRLIAKGASHTQITDDSPPEGKGKEQGNGNGREQGSAAAPLGLNTTAWDRWYDYRVQIRKPLKQASIPAAQKALAAYGSDQEAVVDQSIANGWQGLFPLKQKNGSRPTLATHNQEVARRWAERGSGNA